MMNRKGFVRKLSLPNRSIILACVLEDIKAAKDLSQYSRCPNKCSKQGPPGQKPGALAIHPPAQCSVYCRYYSPIYF